MAKVISKTGMFVGSLFILEETGKSGTSGKIYNSRCKCGEERLISSGSIRRAIREGYNISCNTCEFSDVIILKDKSITSFNSLYSQYKNGAKKRGYTFDLTKEYFSEIIKNNCFYCGVEPYQKNKTYNKKDNGFLIYNGVDRVENSKGYECDNVVACCGVCNLMKRNTSKDDFINHIKKILNNFNVQTEL